MEVPDKILKYYLRNVYFFCGTACGGKTTISRAFANMRGIPWVSEERANAVMGEAANPEDHPAWRSRPNDWETYFNRPYREYWEWLEDCARESLPVGLLELAIASRGEAIAADVYNLRPSDALRWTEPRRVVYLAADPRRVARDYFDRSDHRDILECIRGLKDPEAARANCERMLEYGNALLLDEIRGSGLFYIMRDDESTVEATLALVEGHFGLGDGRE